VTAAARDARGDGRGAHPDDAVARDAAGRLVATGPDRVTVTLEALRAMADGRELVTIHAGDAIPADELDRLLERVRADLPDLAIEGLRGGQPDEAYLVAVE
jgi:dihydroxyacetone kinase-like predicted kinase